MGCAPGGKMEIEFVFSEIDVKIDKIKKITGYQDWEWNVDVFCYYLYRSHYGNVITFVEAATGQGFSNGLDKFIEKLEDEK